MSQYIISVIRTWVPIIIGWGLAKLVVLGVIIPDDQSTNLKNTITLLVIGLYYAAVRWLEQKFPRVGILLGYIKQPIYVDPTKTSDEQEANVRVAVSKVSADPTSVSGNEGPPPGEWPTT